MEKRMSEMGVGHKAGAVVGGYMVLTVVLSHVFSPLFRITSDSYIALVTAGIVMVVVGFSLNLATAFQMLKAYKKDTLATAGLYGIFLHPMYFFQLINYAESLKANQVKKAVLVTSSASTSMRRQADIRRILTEKGVEVLEEITCPGSFLFIKLGHPNTADVKKATERAKQIVEQI